MQRYIGIDLGGTNIKGALVSETGKILKQRSAPHPYGGRGRGGDENHCRHDLRSGGGRIRQRRGHGLPRHSG